MSSKILFDPAKGAFECPAPGELHLAAAHDKAGRPIAEPMKVKWAKSMTFQREPERVALFHGSVEAYRQERKVSGGTLRIDFDAEMNPLKITAKDNAVLELKQASEAPDKAEAGPAEAAPAKESKAVVSWLGEGATDWRISGDVLVGEPPKKLLSAPGGGLLELLYEDRPNDSIRWTGKMTADFLNSFARFEGAVDGNFSGSRLQCETLRLDFNAKKELRHVNSEGKVKFKASGENAWELTSDAAEAILAAGGVLDHIIAKKDVQLEDGKRTVKSQMLKLFFEQIKGQKERSVSRADATKNVSVDYRDETGLKALCDRLQWNAKDDIYVLTGKPARLTRGPWREEGETILIDRKTGVMRVPRGTRPAATKLEHEAQ